MKIMMAAHQKGFSIVELMIALLIGSLVTGSILQMMVSYSESSRVNDYLVTAQGNGRHSLYLLSRAVHMAGYRERFSYDPAEPFYHGACLGDTTNPCTTDGGGTDSDRIAIRYEPL
nr:prepilin-type N-terminal cleavage/methylation domain-containing protein [Endozoicomonas sp.]